MYSFTDQFILQSENLEVLNTTMMGPNVMRITEELTQQLDIRENARILDLGCGRGLSSLFLAEKYGAVVIAADLWISPTENYKQFESWGIADRVIPISVDATKGLPFAEEYFDALISVDSYHYFGDESQMLDSLIPFVKKGGYLAIAIPGLKQSFDSEVPEEMQPWWNIPEVARTIRSIGWWQDLWSKTEGIEIKSLQEMACCREAWDEWLNSGNPIAADDIPMMQAEGGKYFNFIQLIARVI